ncbi:MAG: hypothetical protein PHD54_08940 [Desulfuromonadaceae bacterium]|nr:hypothetical protein [Desulfuromonadaceae bacterium]
MTTPNNQASYLRLIRGSLICASVLLLFDAVNGTFISAGVCPIWFLVSLVKAIKKRPGWGIGVSRIIIPILTLAIVAGNAAMQSKIANANAERIIVACEQFRSATGKYPDRLDELVPKYLTSIPQARYALMFSDFRYRNPDGNHQLMWDERPPFGRRIYDFEQRKWRYHAD